VLNRRAPISRRLASTLPWLTHCWRKIQHKRHHAGLSVFTVGGVVTTKDVLMRLVPDDHP
jgi:hypothetical protein